LSLKIDQKCTIHGLDKASNNATFDSSTNKATISGFYADCNDSSATPQIKFSSINGLNSSDPTKSSYQLADSNGEKISYGIKIGTTDATVNTAVNIPKASADIVFTATPTQSATSPTSGTYSDTVTATITL
jgi:spore coat protein U-like protein